MRHESYGRRTTDVAVCVASLRSTSELSWEAESNCASLVFLALLVLKPNYVKEFEVIPNKEMHVEMSDFNTDKETRNKHKNA
jgi:hypothetical protein